MGKFEVKRISNLLDFDLNRFLEQSKKEGFRIVERLVTDYKNGSNTFNLIGESLFGVFNEEGLLVAIGGLNKDPFSKEQCIGRLRRFYVIKEYRRNGIGSLLVTKLIEEAKRYYEILVLHTDTEEADKFYTSLGFLKKNLYPSSSHYMEFKS
ncbi:GNAT family N-acetyltransferase [Robertmurraya yapensis]|uniref:GNAT family N-acetyltransferase n=1 Tax=Bacillus yapensis TaxID=2492960 RepID=A0A3S0KQW9_9BACI|nr:GNAT family N-acetyltransferase [Bacillus yapensis]RTR36227.1 GNAT family N-acetyltransferase [Bacillus yapensis]TKT05730.1 GNAT family N-acetyltransferase [Bacillus yapensis]